MWTGKQLLGAVERLIVDLGVPRSSRGGGTNEINHLDLTDVPQQMTNGTSAELP